MRKNIVIIICMIMIFSLTACGKVDKQEYKVLEAGGYDYVSDASHKEEINVGTVTHKDALDKSPLNIQVNGIDFTGEYLRTQEWYYYNGTVNTYRQEFENGMIQVGVNVDTGKIVRYSYHSKDSLKDTSTNPKTEFECEKIAKDYLGKYVNLKGYELVETVYREISTDEGVYDFRYVRIVDNIQTGEMASIGVNNYGDITFHVLTLPDEFENAVIASREKKGDIDSEVRKKLDSIYGAVSDKYDYTYETKRTVYTRMKDGNYVYEYDVEVKLVNKEGKDSISEPVKLFVYV